MNILEIKKTILEKLINLLEEKHIALVQSALEAKDAATSEESKAENKYDTRGLEASYLAGAQAKRSKDMERAIHNLKTLKLKDLSQYDSVQLTALVELSVNSNEETKFVFLLPYAGGYKIDLKNITYQVITPESPLGALVLKKNTGDSFSLKNKNITNEYEIIQIY